MKVAVIGGGWAGLAAAVELTGGGAKTTLFEAGRVLGGRAREINIDGRQLDNGQHLLLGAYGDTLALMRRVGADPEKLLERRPLQIVDNAGFRMALPRLPAPLNLAWGLLAARGVDLGEKLKTALWMDGIKKQGFRLEKDSSVADWLDAVGQTGNLRRHLWEPLCLAALNTPAHAASAQLFANVLRDSLGSPQRAATDLLLPRVTLGELLPEPASHWLNKMGAELRLGTRIDHIAPTDEGISLNDQHFDAAILATAPQHATKLWPALNPNFSYQPIATVYLQFGPETHLAFPMLNLFGKVGQWVIDRGQGLLACVLSGHGDWENIGDEALPGILTSELGIDETALWHRVIREKRATFTGQPDLARPTCRTSYPRLFLAGDYTWAEYPATLEGAVRSGLRAARQVLGTYS